jgi:hypothetical protein
LRLAARRIGQVRPDAAAAHALRRSSGCAHCDDLSLCEGKGGATPRAGGGRSSGRAPHWGSALARWLLHGERLRRSSPYIWQRCIPSRLERFGFKGAGARSEQNLDAEAHSTLRRTHPSSSRDAVVRRS